MTSHGVASGLDAFDAAAGFSAARGILLTGEGIAASGVLSDMHNSLEPEIVGRGVWCIRGDAYVGELGAAYTYGSAQTPALDEYGASPILESLAGLPPVQGAAFVPFLPSE